MANDDIKAATKEEKKMKNIENENNFDEKNYKFSKRDKLK
jgi:hypothetical protein